MSDDGSSTHDSDPGLPPEETLIGGRAKRANAGNRLSILLQAYEEADLQRDLLEDEEDDQRDYEASDDGGDIDLESSDESDDEGPPKDGEEEKLEGEKELQNQERTEARKRKRRAQDLLKIPPLRKKARLADATTTTSTTDTTSTDTPTTAKPRKKSERMSWLPTPEDAPTRQSMRKATVINKEYTEARLKESQKRAVKAHELIRIAAERRAADAAPALTQADRLARALKVEKENSKSLNKWVQVEEERRIAQRKRLEALRNKKLEGPVVRYWSGSVIWEGDQIKVKRVHQPKIVEVEDESNVKPAAERKMDQDSKPMDQDGKSVEKDGKPVEQAAAHQSAVSQPSVQPANSPQQPPDPPTVPGSPSTVSKPEQISKTTDEKDTSQSLAETSPNQAVPDGMIKADQVSEPMQLDIPDSDTKNDPTPTTNPLPEPSSSVKADLISEANPALPTTHLTFDDEIRFWASQSPAVPDRKQESAAPTSKTPTESNEQHTVPVIHVPTHSPSLHQHGVTSKVQELNQQQVLNPTNTNSSSDLPAPSQQLIVVQAPQSQPLTVHPSSQQPSQPSICSPAAHQNQPVSATETAPPSTPDDIGTLPTVPIPSSTETQESPVPVLPPPDPPAPLLREQALRTLLSLEAFPELENLPAPIITSTSATTNTASSRLKSAPTVPPALATLILGPDSQVRLTPAQQKYLTTRSQKRKGDNLLPDKPSKPSCVITAKEARFRDPKTGLGYRDLAAFKSLQRVIAGGCAWSCSEGCWVGIIGEGGMGRVARGVPEGFWSGVLPERPPVPAATATAAASSSAPISAAPISAAPISAAPISAAPISAAPTSASPAATTVGVEKAVGTSVKTEGVANVQANAKTLPHAQPQAQSQPPSTTPAVAPTVVI